MTADIAAGPAVRLPEGYLERLCEHRWFPLLYPRPELPVDRGPSSWFAFYAGRFLEAGNRATAILGGVATRARAAQAALGRLFVAFDLAADGDDAIVYGIRDGDVLYVADAARIDE